MNGIRIAVVSMQSIFGEIDTNIYKTYFWVKQAKKLNVDIICFPELSITGYDNDFGVSRISLSCSSKEIKYLLDISFFEKITIMVGIAEKDVIGETYITHLVITPNGRIGRYRKIHLSPGENRIFTKGNFPILFYVNGVNIGIQLCYDSHFPELSTLMAIAGADIIFIPHASPHGNGIEKHISWMRHLPARAFDNCIFVIACNQAGDNGKNLNFSGNALIISPFGKIIKKKISNQEGILIVDLNKKILKLTRKHKIRYFLSNRRLCTCKNVGINILLNV